MKILTIYLCIINVVSLIFMIVDKWKAINHRWRVPEKTLLALCAIGGSVGSLLGLLLFRHKTRHPMFSIGIPLMLVVHIVILFFVYRL